MEKETFQKGSYRKTLPLIMTPGPTQVRENVRLARARAVTNPDLDMTYFDVYRETCRRIAAFLKTKNACFVLGGEGMLGLEAACASLIEPEDRVLVVDNGLFGEWFSDFVTLYGGVPVFFKGDRTRDVSVEDLAAFLEKETAENGPFKCATIVHCDTPSGVLNDISRICPLLKKYGILTIVDSVSAMGGEDVRTDDWQIDILIGGSQKAISAPPGLTIAAVSDDAFSAMEKRQKPIASYYANLLIWKNYYETKWFPYTPPISDIYGLDAAVGNILDEGNEPGQGILRRHEKIAAAFRKAVTEAGLSLHLNAGWCSTVTVIDLPQGISSEDLLNTMLEKHNIMIAGSFGYLSGKVIRIGHMGENANIPDVARTLRALALTLEEKGFTPKADPEKVFLENVREN